MDLVYRLKILILFKGLRDSILIPELEFLDRDSFRSL